jgi:hypothetical protein
MKITAKKAYHPDHPNEFAAATTHGKEVKASPKYWFRCEHSPIRLFRYLIRYDSIKLFISTHLVRHGKFAEHACMTMRDDLRPEHVEDKGRETLVNHIIETNAQELIAISRKRLCYKSHRETVATWTKTCNAIKEVEPDLHTFLVPECVYRNGICPEHKECDVGLNNVMRAYVTYPLMPSWTKRHLSCKD